MASFIDGLRQNQQQAQDAEAYRSLVRAAEDSSLARNAAMQTKMAYDNADMGYGLSRADIAKAIGRPTSEVSVDTLSDQELQQLGYAKMASQKAEASNRERIPLSPDATANQASMQQAANDMGNGRLGLAGQMAGRQQVNPAVADRFVNQLPTPGGFEQNATRTPVAAVNLGNSGDMTPEGDKKIQELKRSGAY